MRHYFIQLKKYHFIYCKGLKEIEVVLNLPSKFKFAVLVGNCPFFVFNRLLSVYLAQAHKLLYQYGIMPKHVDAVVVSYGFLMGPLTMNDMNGWGFFF